MASHSATWTVAIGMGLLLLTPSVVLIGFLIFRRRRYHRPRRQPRGFPVVQNQHRPPPTTRN